MRRLARPQVQAGIALLTAMIVLALVTTAAVAMASRQQLDIRRAANLIDADQAYLQALGVESWAEGVLLQDARSNATDSLQDTWAHALPAQEIQGGKVAGAIEDLQGRFNLNDLRPEAGAAEGTAPGAGKPLPVKSPEQAAAARPATPAEPTSAAIGGVKLAAQRFRRLLAILGLDPGITDAVMDWLDADSDPRFPDGAEDGWYMRQNPPYRAANRMMTRPGELLLVRGMTPSAYARLRPFVTALPGYTAINVNTASPEVLMSLARGISRADADRLVARRTAEPFTTVQAFLQSPALAGRKVDAEGLGVASSYFAVHSAATVAGARVDLMSIISRMSGAGVSVVRRVQGDPGNG